MKRIEKIYQYVKEQTKNLTPMLKVIGKNQWITPQKLLSNHWLNQ